jgi:Ca2+-binding RTX toxin-like protein
MPIFRFEQDFIVNTTTAEGQYNPVIAAMAGGRQLVVWDSMDSGDGAPTCIRGRFYDASGSPAGSDFIVNTTTTSDQDSPAVTTLTDGRLVVTWASYESGDGSLSCVRARLFDANGNALGNDFIVNTTATGYQFESSVTALANGCFVVAWSSEDSGDGSQSCVRARLYNANGNPAGADFILNSTATDEQGGVALTALAHGGFAATWASADSGDGAANCIRARMFDAHGNPAGSDFIVNTAATGEQSYPAVTALTDGRLVVTWYSADGGDGVGGCIRGRIYNPDGGAAGDDFIVNSTTEGSQSVPAVAALSDGRFVVTWSSEDPGDGSGTCIRGRLYNVDGSAAGDDFVVNSTAANYQFPPSVTALPDSRFVVTWHSADPGDGSGTCIRAQVFAPTTFNGTDGADSWQGGNLADEIRGFDSDDTLFGLGGDDEIEGDTGNDMLVGGAGADQLRGGAGDDTAVFSGGFDAYTFSTAPSADFVIGPDGFDVLTGIEHLQFADGRVDLDDGSALFNTLYYVSQNSDIYHAGVHALDHFNTFGWREGRDPVEEFDTSGYLAVNRDVAAVGINPLEQYHQHGWREGRDPSAGFDTTLYLLRNPDVAAAGIDPLEHYLAHGRAEGRSAYDAVGPVSNGFDAQYYLFENPDVAAAGVDPLLHYNVSGWREGRDPNGWFTTSGYLDHYTDVAAAGINPFDHYMAIGWTEGRDASTWFDTRGYLAANPDVAATGMNPLDHFLQYGIYEGRTAINDGHWY